MNAGSSATSPTIPQNDVWEFKHPDFRRGDVHQLQLIKRKVSKTGNGLKVGGFSTEFSGDKDQQINFLSNKVCELEEKLFF